MSRTPCNAVADHQEATDPWLKTLGLRSQYVIGAQAIQLNGYRQNLFYKQGQFHFYLSLFGRG